MNKKKLTQEDIQLYVDNEGNHCPYCESEHGIDNHNGCCECRNPDCEEKWEDQIEIIGITEYE